MGQDEYDSEQQSSPSHVGARFWSSILLEGIARPPAVDTCFDPSMASGVESAVAVGACAGSVLDQMMDGQSWDSFEDMVPASPPEKNLRMILGDQIDPLDRVPVTPDDAVASPHTPENIMRSVQRCESSVATYGYQPATPVFGAYTPPGTPPNTPVGSPPLTPRGTPPGTPPGTTPPFTITPSNSPSTPRQDSKMHDADDESTKDDESTQVSPDPPGTGEANQKQMPLDKSGDSDFADATSSSQNVNKRKWAEIFEIFMGGPCGK